MLNVIRHEGPAGAPPLVIAHGLFGSAKNWGGVARRLAEGREVLAVDMRNHGDSFRAPVHDYPAMAADLAEVIEAAGGEADLLGHSMGGKAAMTLALTRPELVRRLVVADIAPVAYGHSQMRYVEAMEGLDLGAVRRRSEADAALRAAVPELAVRAFLLQSLAVGPEGASWRLNLPALRDQMPAIMTFPDLKGPYEGPALFLAGGASDYVLDAYWPQIAALFPQARLEQMEGAGHWLHAEQPEAFAAAADAFLRA